MNICFKHVTRLSSRYTFSSAIVTGHLEVKYALGEKSTGFLGTPLFACKEFDREHCEDFANPVMICEYEPYPFKVDSFPWICHLEYDDDKRYQRIVDFWKDPYNKDVVSRAEQFFHMHILNPDVILCKWIIPLFILHARSFSRDEYTVHFGSGKCISCTGQFLGNTLEEAVPMALLEYNQLYSK